MEWDGSFKADGLLLLPCTERDVDVAEYRRVLMECIAYRDRARATRHTGRVINGFTAPDS